MKSAYNFVFTNKHNCSNGVPQTDMNHSKMDDDFLRNHSTTISAVCCILYIHQCFVSNGVVFLKYTMSGKAMVRIWYSYFYTCPCVPHAGTWGSGGITLCILNLSWWWVLSFTPQSLYCWIGGWVGTRACLDVWGNERFCTFTRIRSITYSFNTVKHNGISGVKFRIQTMIPHLPMP